MTSARPALILLPFVVILSASGCQNAAIVSAQQEAARGRYSVAHQDYEAALSHPEKLNQEQRREALDGLCLTEYLIGAPTYPLERQNIDCGRAAAESGSSSGEVLAKIERALRAKAELRTEQALRDHDLSEAVWGAQDYSRKPGASQEKVAQWSVRMWQLIAVSDYARKSLSRRRLRRAILRLSRENPHLRRLSRPAFERWVLAQVTVNGRPLASALTLSVKSGTLHFWVPKESMAALATNLDRLSRVNDGFAVWCGCDAKTDVGLSTTGLPAYLLRLDPDTARSEVVVLARVN
jgi:hypothetical protein